MSIIAALPYALADGQIADAVPVQSNFDWIVSEVNANAGPASPNTSIQFNNSGAFGGSPNLRWDGSNIINASQGIHLAGTMYSTGQTNPASGIGTAVGYNTTDGLGYVQAYDWGAAVYKPLVMEGIEFGWQIATEGPYVMTLDTNESLLIGYTTTNGSSYLLQVNSQIYATNATIATSDGTVKKNVENLGEASGIIRKLRPVTFDFIPHPVHNFSEDRQIGFIAQDVQAALDGASYGASIVKKTCDHIHKKTEKVIAPGLLGLADSKLIPLLVKAWQELDSRISALEGGTPPIPASDLPTILEAMRKVLEENKA